MPWFEEALHLNGAASSDCLNCLLRLSHLQCLGLWSLSNVCGGGMCLSPQRSTLLVPRCLFLMASKYTSRLGCERAPPQRAHAGPGQGLRGQSTPATPSSCGQLKQGPKLFPGQQRSRRLWVGTQALKESSGLGKDALPMQQLLSGEQLIQIENVSPGGFCLIMQCFLHA